MDSHRDAFFCCVLHYDLIVYGFIPLHDFAP